MTRSRRVQAGFAAALLLALASHVSAQGWARTLGGPDGESALAIATTRDGGFIMAGATAPVGARAADLWVVRFDASGGIRWQRAFGSGFFVVREVAEAIDGDILVAGNVEVERDSWRPRIVRMTPDGSIRWSRRYDFTTEGGLKGFTELPDGSMAVVGMGYDTRLHPYVLRVDASGEVASASMHGVGDDAGAVGVAPTSDGGLLVVGVVLAQRILLLRFDAAGSPVGGWSLDPAGNNFLDEQGPSLAIEATPDRGWIIAGSTETGGDLNWHYESLALKLDASASVEWCRSLDTARYVSCPVARVAPSVDGGYLLLGRTTSDPIANVAGVNGAFVLRLDAGGDLAWQWRYGVGRTWAGGLAALPDGGALVAGADSGDALLLRLDSSGRVATGCGFVDSPGVVSSAVAVASQSTVVDVRPLAVAVEEVVLTARDTAASTVAMADRFEPDDACAEATRVVEGATQVHDFCDDAEDWFELQSCAGVGYWIIARAEGALVDLVVDVLAPDCSTVLASASGRDCLVDWTSPADGLHHVRVRQADGTAGAAHQYSFTVLRTTAGCETWSNAYLAGYQCRGAGAPGLGQLPDGRLVLGATDTCGYMSVRQPVLVKVGSDGEVLDALGLGTPAGVLQGLGVTPEGNVLVAGGTQAWMAMLDGDGRVLWRKTHEPQGIVPLEVAQVVALRNGDCLAVGVADYRSGRLRPVATRLDARGEILWETDVTLTHGEGARDAVETASGKLVVFSLVQGDAWVLGFDAAGGLLRQRTFELASALRYTRRVVGAAPPAGGCIMAAASSIVRLDDDLLPTWHRAVRGPGGEDFQASAVAATRDGGCVVAGRATSAAPSRQVLLKQDATGRLEWQRDGLSALRLLELQDGRIAGVTDTASLGAWVIDRNGLRRGECAGTDADLFLSDWSGAIGRPLGQPALVPRVATDVLLASTAFSPQVTPYCHGSGPSVPLEVSPPGVARQLAFTGRDDLAWQDASASGADTFNVYRSDVARVRRGDYGTCVASGLPTSAWSDPDRPPLGVVWTYLVTGRNAAGEGAMGRTSRGDERANATPCP